MIKNMQREKKKVRGKQENIESGKHSKLGNQ
jgi:hypothetical protein